MTSQCGDTDRRPRVETESKPALLMRSVARVEVTDSPDKVVWLPSEERSITMGMHDELADYYKAVPGSFEPHASTLDYVVGAVAACLTGTFKRALIARGIRISPGDLKSEAVGEIVVEVDVPILRSVTVRYVLTGSQYDDHEKIHRAHAVHHKACAVSRSLDSAIAISTALELA